MTSPICLHVVGAWNVGKACIFFGKSSNVHHILLHWASASMISHLHDYIFAAWPKLGLHLCLYIWKNWRGRGGGVGGINERIYIYRTRSRPLLLCLRAGITNGGYRPALKNRLLGTSLYHFTPARLYFCNWDKMLSSSLSVYMKPPSLSPN